MSKMSRRCDMQKKLELDTLRMQMFYLEPYFEYFLEILDNTKLTQSSNIDCWKNACLAQYGSTWAVDYEHPILSDESIANAQEWIQTMITKLQYRLKINPRAGSLDNMWYIFFATGDLGCLREVYQVGGSGGKIAVIAVEQYQNFRNIYERKLKDVGLDINVFKQLDDEISAAMTQLRDAQTLGDPISPEMKKVLDADDGLDRNRLDVLKKFISPDLENTLKQIANEQKKMDNLDSKGNPMPKGYVEYTKRREQKELKRVSELFDKVASTFIV